MMVLQLHFHKSTLYLIGGRIPENMRYISNILVSVILGFFFTFLYAFSSSKISKADTQEIMRNVKKRFIIGKATITKVGERKVYSPQAKNRAVTGIGLSSGSGFGSYGHSASRTFCWSFGGTLSRTL